MTNSGYLGKAVAALLLCHAVAFVPQRPTLTRSARHSTGNESDNYIDPSVSAKFKILTCTSTSCCQKRKQMHMDEYATFGALYQRIQESEFDNVEIEEAPCLGSCQMAPCVAIEHADFDGSVSLMGMTDNEFVKKSFHHIITEDDADRVWSCVDGAIRMMAAEEEEEEQQEFADDDTADLLAVNEGYV